MNANPKTIGLLSIVLLLSCFTITLSSAATSAYEVQTVASGPSFSFGTPTPPPTATPVPTAKPSPTPRPEPSARPTLQMTLTSAATSNNPKITISGTLTYNHTGIEGAPIYAAYSADNGIIWQNFSLVQTHADGSFSTSEWIPNATGNYLVSTQWDGNLTLHWLNTSASLALTSDSLGNEFSVSSNSTISGLTYDSTNRQIGFQTNGTTNTAGYLNICIPKTLAADAQALQLKMDGNSQNFGIQSQDDIWVISCTYQQSSHNFVVQIPAEIVFSPVETPWLMIAIAVIVVIAVIAILMVVRRKRRTAATVAEILKDDRPVF